MLGKPHQESATLRASDSVPSSAAEAVKHLARDNLQHLISTQRHRNCSILLCDRPPSMVVGLDALYGVPVLSDIRRPQVQNTTQVGLSLGRSLASF